MILRIREKLRTTTVLRLIKAQDSAGAEDSSVRKRLFRILRKIRLRYMMSEQLQTTLILRI